VQLPYKKPQNGELTEEQKNYNHQLSKKRVKIEHSFAKIKRFRVLRDVFRSPAEGFRNSIFKIVCDLYNYIFNRKLKQASSRFSPISNYP
jgi:tRNA/tmRNA/rRNA uracil-C5-methylase (TrmA/RlmC/RlmD family)